MSQEPYISIVIPAYNEERRIGKSLESIFTFLESEGVPFEVVVVDDGSRDNTIGMVKAFLKGAPQGKLIQNEENRGKGFTVRRGMLAASGRHVIFSDADLSTPIQEARKFLPLLEKQYDIVIGSRQAAGSNVVVRQQKYRELMGKTFNLFVRALVVDQIADTQCGFKGFRQTVARDVFQRQRLFGFSFDVEILYIAHRLGYAIREEPIEWHNSFESKVNVFTDSTQMLLDLFKIRWLHRNLKELPASGGPLHL
ncbi:MAG: glycosyltransferase family 2 protein [Acidobacteria bacterium]|nr:glycosyltransferase family 2 protein [Acidobacteriota bacterium]MBI3655834.1 glycosyltransferase family 2 protein [Acidobacteriota bacterium]